MHKATLLSKLVIFNEYFLDNNHLILEGITKLKRISEKKTSHFVASVQCTLY